MISDTVLVAFFVSYSVYWVFLVIANIGNLQCAFALWSMKSCFLWLLYLLIRIEGANIVLISKNFYFSLILP